MVILVMSLLILAFMASLLTGVAALPVLLLILAVGLSIYFVGRRIHGGGTPTR